MMGWRVSLLGRASTTTPQGEEEGPDPRRITEFSRRSKASMRRRILSIPWGDYMRPGDMIHVVTLTAPGEDFRRHLGDRRQAGRALKRFTDRLSYATEGTRDRGPARQAWEAGGCVGPFIFGARFFWKLEFQLREAPHWHLVIIAPAVLDGMAFRDWCAKHWAEAVGSGQASHLRAGTRVDVQASIEASDVQRLTLYFSGYSTVKDKQYQHQVPEWWYDENGSAGRFWGVVGLDSYTVEIDLHTTMATHIKRLFRSRQRSQRGHVKVADMPEAKYRKWRAKGRTPTTDWRFKTPLTKKRVVYRLKPRTRRLDRTGPQPGARTRPGHPTHRPTTPPNVVIHRARSGLHRVRQRRPHPRRRPRPPPHRPRQRRTRRGRAVRQRRASAGKRAAVSIEREAKQVPERLLYRVEEACELLSLSRSRIFELLRSGQLRSVKEGRTRLISRAALVDFVAALEREAAA